MRYIIAAICFLTFFLMNACTQYSPDAKLVLADSLMQNHPDSALHILQSIHSEHFKKYADQAYYALLLTQANDKNYILQTSDSLINIAVHYYDSTKNVPFQAKAHFYLGCIWRDKNDCSQAIKEYITIIPLAKKANNKKLLSLIYNNIGYIYYIQNFNEKADSIYAIVESLAILQKDSTLWAEAISMRGKIIIGKGIEFYPQAEQQILKALKISHSIKQKATKAKIYSSLSQLYSRMNNAPQAIEFAKQSAFFQDDSNQLNRTFLLLGDAYYKIGLKDSALVYLQKSLLTNEYMTKAGIYMRLADIAKERGNLQESLDMERKHSAYLDSSQLKRQDLALVNTEKTILAQHLEQKRQITLHLFIYILIAVLIVLFSSIVYFLFKHSGYQRESKKLHEKLSMQYEKKRQSDFEKFNISIKSCECSQKIQRILLYHKKYSDYQEHFGELDKKQLMEDIDRLLEHYTLHLKSTFPLLTENDIIFCSLHLINLSITDISIITERTRNSIYKRKQSILENKMHQPQEKDLLEVLREV